MPTLRTYSNSKEAEIVRLYKAGFTVLEIANTLRISPQGVYYHLRKLELPNPGTKEQARQ